MNKLLLMTERIALALWVGGLWAVGLMVAPVLFAQLADRAQAGMIAGNLFMLTALLGLVCGSLLLLGGILRTGRFDWRAWVTVMMLMLVAAGQFVLAPIIGDMRDQGLADSDQFAWMHGLASMLFLLTAGLGLLLVAAGRAR